MMQTVHIQAQLCMKIICRIALGLLILLSLLCPPLVLATAQGSVTPIPSALPSEIQALVDADPPREGSTKWYKIHTYPTVGLAVAANQAIYSIDSTGATFVWQPGDTAPHPLLQVRLAGLAASGNRDAIYGWDAREAWQLATADGRWVSMGRLPSAIRSLAVSPDGTVVYANCGDSLWRWQTSEPGWQPVVFKPSPDFELLLDEKGLVTTAIGEIYAIAEFDVWNGVANIFVDDVVIWDAENSEWISAGWDLGETQVEKLDIGDDGMDTWVLTTDGGLWVNGRNIPIRNDIVEYGIVTVLDENGLYLATQQGLFWTQDSGITWKNLDLRDAHALVSHPTWGVPLIGASSGVYILAHTPESTRTPIPIEGLPAILSATLTPTPTTTPTATSQDSLQQLVAYFRENFWAGPLTALGGFFSTYVLGMFALLLIAWRKGSAILSRSHLMTFAAQPLFIAPGLGRWALFLGYKRRLLEHRNIQQAARTYFGLPAADSTGAIIPPDPDGAALNDHIGQLLGPQRPVLIVGMGGAGKSTLLARWAWLALTNQLPAPLRYFLPVIVTPAYYDGNLIKAIADTLRERDGVAVTEETITTQLQAGRYLILFDGVSEIEQDRQASLNEILRTAHHADYANCRFLIATRPLPAMPDGEMVIHLQPLTVETALSLLPHTTMDRERESRVRRQLQSFGERPIAPLLLAMILAQDNANEISTTSAHLYETYFQRLLGVNKGSLAWIGWQTALEMLAQWFMLETGKRGLGLPHEPLIERLMGAAVGQGAKRDNLVERLRRFYQLPVKDEFDLLQRLDAAGLLLSGRRWRFAHDTFEEYFAASRLFTCCNNDEPLPDLHPWINSPEAQEEFLPVLAFLDEMIDDTTRWKLLQAGWPEAWQLRLKKQ
jgi:hypothetical protein